MRSADVWKQLESHSSERLAYHPSPRSKWTYTTVGEREPDLDYNHRAVLTNEVVLDLDESTVEENFKSLRKVAVRLSGLGINYSVWDTAVDSDGNKVGGGYHIHTFWNRLETVAEPRLLKDLLGEWMVEGTGAKIDKQMFGTHLVRLEHGRYEKVYPHDAWKKPHNGGRGHFLHNEIPEFIWRKYTHKVMGYAVRRMTAPKHRGSKKGLPCCMKYYLSEEFKQHKDGAKRALFVVASYMRKLPDDELLEMLKRFNNYNLREPLTDRQIKAMMNSVRNHKGRPVGCRYRHELLREIGAGHIAEECEASRENGGQNATEKESGA